MNTSEIVKSAQSNLSPDQASGILEFELFRLNALLTAMQPFGELVEREELDQEELKSLLKSIAKVLNPSMGDETLEKCDTLPVFALALSEAVGLSHKVIAAWKLSDKVETEDMKALLEQYRKATEGKVDKDYVLQNLPWMLRAGLASICNGGTVVRLKSV